MKKAAYLQTELTQPTSPHLSWNSLEVCWALATTIKVTSYTCLFMIVTVCLSFNYKTIKWKVRPPCCRGQSIKCCCRFLPTHLIQLKVWKQMDIMYTKLLQSNFLRHVLLFPRAGGGQVALGLDRRPALPSMGRGVVLRLEDWLQITNVLPHCAASHTHPWRERDRCKMNMRNFRLRRAFLGVGRMEEISQ